VQALPAELQQAQQSHTITAESHTALKAKSSRQPAWLAEMSLLMKHGVLVANVEFMCPSAAAAVTRPIACCPAGLNCATSRQ
jgi:BRCT domain type II-containing protein